MERGETKGEQCWKQEEEEVRWLPLLWGSRQAGSILINAISGRGRRPSTTNFKFPSSLSLSHTHSQPLHAGDFISLATSSVLQHKHLRCFICLYCLPRCLLVAAPLSLHSLLLSLLFPYSSVCHPSSLLSPCVLLLPLHCYVCDLLFRQEIKFSLFVPFLAKTHTTPHSPFPCLPPLSRLVPKIYCVVAEFNYKDDNKKPTAWRDKAKAKVRAQTERDKCSQCQGDFQYCKPLYPSLLPVPA